MDHTVQNQRLSDERWGQYHRDGYLKLGKLLTDDELARLQQRIDEIMLGQAAIDYDRLLMQLDSDSGKYGDMPEQTKGFKGPTLGYRKIQDLEHDPLFLAYLQRPLFRDICAHVYGPHATIACFRAMFMNKPSRKGTVLPWHQDGGDGWDVDRDPLVTVWTALDPATIANGCVKVIPGSHKLGLLSANGHTITPQQEQEYSSDDKVVYLELRAGESVLLHNWLLHSSDVNNTDTPRRAFSVCYVDARTRALSKPVRDKECPWSIVFGKGALTPAEDVIQEAVAG
jgi:hypothetical protein